MVFGQQNPLNRRFQLPWNVVSIKGNQPEGREKREGSQVKLYSIAHAIVFQCQLVLEGALALALQENFVRFATNASGHLGFEKLYRKYRMSIRGQEPPEVCEGNVTY